VSHARVFVNGDYLGLFAVIEPIDKRFLRRTLSEDGGYLYEFEWAGAYHFEWLGDDPLRYAEMFESETHESEPAAQRFSTLVQMITATTRESTSAWQRTMSRYFDFDTLLAYLAVENFLSDHDGLAGDWGINNFYLYRFATSDRFQFLPWDKDITFREIDRDVTTILDGNHLFSTAMQFSNLHAAYARQVRRCAAIAAETDGSGLGWLEREVARHANQIRAAAIADQKKAWSNERFEQEVAWMARFARERSGQIERQMGR
jgi:spore coat protein CotH